MQLSEAEWRIMNRVWERSPVTAREVLDTIESDWAYTTVKTMMTRLAKKGALKEKKRDGVSYYEPKLTRRRARGAALRALVDRAFGGALGGMVSHLVDDEKLTKKQRDELRRMLEEGK